jgi:membrane protein
LESLFESPTPTDGRWSKTAGAFIPTLRYCMQTEVHVYALAIAASSLLSFYPFLVVMLTFCRYVLHWPQAADAIYLTLNDYLPGDLAAFLKRNLPMRGTFQITSMFLLLITANGIFEPLEVALNQAWGIPSNRSYLKNQLVSLGMIFMCGGLALFSLMLTAMNTRWHPGRQELWVNLLVFKLAAVLISILTLFLIFWLLPNRRIPPARVVPVAILVGLMLEGTKYVNLLIWPPLSDKLEREYGVFHNSATILIWSFVGAMIVLAGARSAAHMENLNGERLEKDRAS